MKKQPKASQQSFPGTHIPIEPFQSMRTTLIQLPDGFAIGIAFGKDSHILSLSDYAKLAENMMVDALAKLKQVAVVMPKNGEPRN